MRVYLKLLMVLVAILSRFIHPFVVATLAITGACLLARERARKLLVAVTFAWILAVAYRYALSLGALKFEHLVNMLYGYTTFTWLAFFVATTTPQEMRKLFGFNVFTLSYTFLTYSIMLVNSAVESAIARGVGLRYLLRSVAVLTVLRTEEAVETVEVRGG